MTAKFSSTDSNPTHDLCLITDTDLAQLDSGPENRCKIFYQLAEIDTSVRRKIKEQLIIVKRVLRLHQLHIKLMFCYLFQADLKCLFFFFTVL